MWAIFALPSEICTDSATSSMYPSRTYFAVLIKVWVLCGAHGAAYQAEILNMYNGVRVKRHAQPVVHNIAVLMQM